MSEPRTPAGRALLRQWVGHPNEKEVRVVVLAIENQAQSERCLTCGRSGGSCRRRPCKNPDYVVSEASA